MQPKNGTLTDTLHHMDETVNGLAYRLEVALALKHMSQSSLARTIGVKSNTISRIKSGERPGVKTLKSIAAVLDCTYEWLAFGSGDIPDWLAKAPQALSASEIAQEQLRSQYSPSAHKRLQGAERLSRPVKSSGLDQAAIIEQLLNTNAVLADQLKSQTEQNKAILDRLEALEDQVADAATFHRAAEPGDSNYQAG